MERKVGGWDESKRLIVEEGISWGQFKNDRKGGGWEQSTGLNSKGGFILGAVQE